MKIFLNMMSALISAGIFLSTPAAADVNADRKVSVSGVSSGAYEEDKENYYTQEGIEMRMIKAMVDHFISGE